MPKLTSGTPLFEMSGMLEDQKSEQLSVFDLLNTEDRFLLELVSS